jgi:hypothetical protein
MKEQNEELLQATETLLGIIDDRPEFLTLEGAHKAKEAREIIERHRPKPKRLEGWINLYAPDEEYMGFIYLTEEDAKTHCSDYTLRQVHIREVVPVEWEPWTVQTLVDFPNYQAIIDAHNAEMERVTK